MSRLRDLREEKGLKQEDMAAVINTSLPNYCKKENGEIKVSLIEAKIIADYFKKSIEDIFFNCEVSKTETS